MTLLLESGAACQQSNGASSLPPPAAVSLGSHQATTTGWVGAGEAEPRLSALYPRLPQLMSMPCCLASPPEGHFMSLLCWSDSHVSLHKAGNSSWGWVERCCRVGHGCIYPPWSLGLEKAAFCQSSHTFRLPSLRWGSSFMLPPHMLRVSRNFVQDQDWGSCFLPNTHTFSL